MRLATVETYGTGTLTQTLTNNFVCTGFTAHIGKRPITATVKANLQAVRPTWRESDLVKAMNQYTLEDVRINPQENKSFAKSCISASNKL